MGKPSRTGDPGGAATPRALILACRAYIGMFPLVLTVLNKVNLGFRL